MLYDGNFNDVYTVTVVMGYNEILKGKEEDFGFIWVTDEIGDDLVYSCLREVKEELKNFTGAWDRAETIEITRNHRKVAEISVHEQWFKQWF